MIKVYIIGFILLSVGSGYWFIDGLIEENKSMYATIELRDAQLINQDAVLDILKEDTKKQVDSVLDSFITLEAKYSETQEKRNALIKQIREHSEAINSDKPAIIITNTVNDGTGILLNRLENITSGFYSPRSTKDRTEVVERPAEANTLSNEAFPLGGFYE